MRPKIKVKNKNHLKQLIQQEITQHGNKCDLNHIDTFNFVYMSYLFNYSSFNGNISNWDTSNVVDMSGMFNEAKFNGDISNWDTSKVKDISYMFFYSKFNQDISKWDVSEATDMRGIFKKSSFSYDLTSWQPKKITSTSSIFIDCWVPIPYWAKVEPDFIQQFIEAYQLQQKLPAELGLGLPIPKPIIKI